MDVYINHQRRVGVLVDENQFYRRVLRVAHGGVDIVKMSPTDWAREGWLPLPDGNVKHFARVFCESELIKTRRAAAQLKELLTMDQKTMSVAELTKEYNAITGKSVKQFKSKAVALAAIAKAQEKFTSALEKTTTKEPAPAPAAGELATNQETDVATKTKRKTKTKTPTKKAPAKKAAPTKTKKAPAKKANGDARVERAQRVCASVNGAAGLILKLLREGKSREAVLTRVQKDFPKTKLAHVSWYQSMRRTAGERVKEG